MPFILLVLISLPLLEIAALVALGSKIGVLATISLVILTSALGTLLLKLEGPSAFSRLQAELRAGRLPQKELANTAMIVLAAVFLIIPGFVSDVIGLLLFLPPVRKFVIRSLAGRFTVVREYGYREEGGVVDLDENDYRRTDEAAASQSPWRLPEGRN